MDAGLMRVEPVSSCGVYGDCEIPEHIHVSASAESGPGAAGLVACTRSGHFPGDTARDRQSGSLETKGSKK